MPLVSMTEPWDDPDWIFELKYDGFRSLAFIGSDRVRLMSRKRFVYRRYGDLCACIGSALSGHEAVLDGEIVCLDERGVSQFKDLLYCCRPACFAVFDLLSLDGHDMRGLPLIERKRRLRGLIGTGPDLLYLNHFDGCGTALFREVRPVGPRRDRCEIQACALRSGAELGEDQESQLLNDDKPHHVTFQEPTDTGRFYSDEPSKEVRPSNTEEIATSLRQRIVQRGRRNLRAQAQELDASFRALVNTRNRQRTQQQRINIHELGADIQPLRRVAYIARQFFDCQMLFVTET